MVAGRNHAARCETANVDDATMRERVREARVGRLATVTGEGRPHVVPCCFVLAGDAAVVYSAVDGKPKSTLELRRLANIRANPYASLLVDQYADDWSALWWVRVDGAARVVHEGGERDQAIAALTAKYDQYVGSPPRGAVVALDVSTWRAWP
jgi:PPOX class probable F420-dependent enzyme